jgi:hypothetical protein
MRQPFASPEAKGCRVRERDGVPVRGEIAVVKFFGSRYSRTNMSAGSLETPSPRMALPGRTTWACWAFFGISAIIILVLA